ncbi:LuxR C-terminal-related transcriptional regulator [Couchioplanes caeruleus]|uniref:DNA-binding CsgD family transcriptional regulator n=1 Tax=Couchioplanes caeruleus TaxID=56438 RepID=A0A3N1GDT3_9ACTN|nr:LuxR C-terminal-related transcriptional regulator [Couchioplanes caeruleus]ROP28346.1 DNA-binding CsgD family transcriptional regulator [Couchioplanes caeruleus]
MSSRVACGDRVVAEVAQIAAMPAGITARAEAVLAPLHRLIRFDAARIALLDSQRRRQPALSSHGYDEKIQQYLQGPETIRELELLGLERDRTPLRMKDLTICPSALTVWREQLHPAGFREGIAVPLVTADGRYLGLFGANTVSATPLSDAARDLLQRLAPLIAHAVDPMRSITTLAALVGDAVAGVVLTHTGDTVAVPGLPGHRLLTPGAPVPTEAATCYADGDTRAAFLTPSRQTHAAPGYLKATMLACPDQSPHDLTAIVLLSPPGDLHRLSHREMTVLGMLITGFAPAQVIARLGITAATMRTALEHARIKLGAPSCEAAVMRAADRGLYLPPTIATPR